MTEQEIAKQLEAEHNAHRAQVEKEEQDRADEAEFDATLAAHLKAQENA